MPLPAISPGFAQTLGGQVRMRVVHAGVDHRHDVKRGQPVDDVPGPDGADVGAGVPPAWAVFRRPQSWLNRGSLGIS